MKRHLVLLLTTIVMFGCKNSGQGTSSTEKKETMNKNTMEQIIVNRDWKPESKPDFQVTGWKIQGDVLTATVQYSGGCGEHDFKAYFNGSWMKSLPPKAQIHLEHLDLDNDRCRSVVSDTLTFDLKPVRYSAAQEVTVSYAADTERFAPYRYSNDSKEK